jgi:hypothetical protein
MEIFNIVASISTAIGSFLIFLTLIEMIKQRRALYRPEIIVENCTEKDEIEKAELMNNISRMESIEISGINFIKIYNIGLGAGKNINIHWDFNINDLILYINNNNYMKKYDVKYNKQKNIIKIDDNFSIKTIVNTDLDKLKSIDHLLPVNSDYSPRYINVPISYLLLIGIALNLTPMEDIECINNKLSYLNIKIEYKDISDIKITKKYILTPNIFMLSSKDKVINKINADFKIELLNK